MTFKRISLVILAVIAVLVLLSFRTTQYPVFEMTADAPPEGGHHVLLFGGTRNTGLEVAKLLTARGDRVTAFVRPSSDRSGLEPLGVDFAVGDALDPETVQAAFEAGDYTAAITTVGCFSCDPRPDYLGNANIFDAAAAAGVERMLLVTTIGAGDSFDAAPWMARLFLREILPLKTQAEEHLVASGLEYTIIRPGALRSEAPTGTGYLSESRDAEGMINRSDLAGLIVEALDDSATAGKVLAAVDSGLSYPWDMF
ncbi:SDR family oxidoreductase [Candidatus Foliamicus sp.]